MKTIDHDPAASIPVADGAGACWMGWPDVVERLRRAIAERCSAKPILVVECYPGVNSEEILGELQRQFQPALAISAAAALHAPKRIESLTRPCLEEPETRRRRFPALALLQFFDAERLWHARREIEDLREGLVIVVGCGASLIAWGHVLVYADLTRREARLRLATGNGSNLGVENQTLAAEKKLQIASLIDWPVADRWKRPLIVQWDFVLETNHVETPMLVDGEAVQRGLHLAAHRPFRFAPSQTSDKPGLISATSSPTDSAWREENLRLLFGSWHFELPALNLLLAHPRAVLGEVAFLRFGFDCPLPGQFEDLPTGACVARKRGEGWREEWAVLKTEPVAIELHRLRFERGVPQQTNDHLVVLRLLDGPQVTVESPGEAFAPTVCRPGETVIVPAAVGEFIVRPAGLATGKPWVILKAWVCTRA